MGTPQFAVASLNKLLSEKFDIVGIVTVPDKPQGRGQSVQASPVKIAAQKYNLPILQPEKLKDERFIFSLKEFKPELIVVVAFRILPEEVFTIPPFGTINLHGSLLPKYRGAAPINRAIMNGEKETGATTFFIQKSVDTGNIIDMVKIPITENMTAGELHDIMAEKGAILLAQTCKKILTGNVETILQDNSLVTKAPKIHKDDCQINFNQPVETVHNFIRGLSPYPAAYTKLNDKTIKLFSSQVHDKKKIEFSPGTISKILNNQEFIIQCNPGLLSIKEVQLEGKKRIGVGDFLRGFRNQTINFFG